MKKLIFVILFLLCYIAASSQDYFQEATACFEKGDYECAKRNYTLFQMLDGRDMSMQIKLAEECLRIIIEADGCFKDMEYEKAMDHYQLVMEKNPKDPIAQRKYDECVDIVAQNYLKEAIACFENGEYENAKRNYIFFQTFDGGDVSEQIKLADECLRIRNLADDYFKDGEYEKARDRYKSVLGKNAKDTVAQKLYNECIQMLAEGHQRINETQQQMEQKYLQNIPITMLVTSGISLIDEIFHYLVYVEGGTFMMGSNDKDASKAEKPVHQVTVSSYMIGKYPVTQREWQAVMGNNPSYFKGDDLPVECVSWNDVQEFIQKLNRLTGKEYRLPTEAEWEFAARGGNSSRRYKYAGSNNIDDIAWYSLNSGVKTHPVGLKRANELRLYDMSGNVWEWCSDWSGSYGVSAVINPQGPSIGQGRVLRGGDWYVRATDCRSTCRRSNPPDSYSKNVGFRLAISLSR